MTNAPRTRRWFQFRLRTLLIGVLVLSLPLSWFGARLRKARRQREAVNAIERVGGEVAYQWESVTPGTPPASTWLRTTLGGDFFDQVAEVEIWCTDVTDADLKHLEALPDLQLLIVLGPRVTDAGLTHLESLPNLQTLSLLHSQITDNGLEHLEELVNLKELVIQCPEITDAGLAHLEADLINLEYLSLRFTQTTDAGLEHLRGLSKLQELHLENTKVTPEGVKRLQEALPNCEIEY